MFIVVDAYFHNSYHNSHLILFIENDIINYEVFIHSSIKVRLLLYFIAVI